MFPFFFRIQGGGRAAEENLDRPLSNFDVIGIPTEEWSSSLFSCHQNLVPSCVMSFFCPCIMWAQIVIRAQIPLLISIKNAIPSCQLQSGYGLFIDYFFWSVVIMAGLIAILALVSFPAMILFYLVVLALIVIGGGFIYLQGHTRTAFKEKYRLRSVMPPGCLGFDMLLDILISTVCMPCSLSQMARHVFQYDRMDEELGLFYQDPYALPPLRPLSSETGTTFERPNRADNAGLSWTSNERHPNVRDNRGRAHREEELLARQRQELLNEQGGAGATAPPMAVAVPVDRA